MASSNKRHLEALIIFSSGRDLSAVQNDLERPKQILLHFKNDLRFETDLNSKTSNFLSSAN